MTGKKLIPIIVRCCLGCRYYLPIEKSINGYCRRVQSQVIFAEGTYPNEDTATNCPLGEYTH